ncbi:MULTISPECIES: hypothetical protein [Pectobacterium]|uniref:hypothetical protein n=1 Tax=Pectobacterium TaxID=122277 RepID=UPI00101DEA41|nr:MULTISPECIES: hypothetical protein [Pectobacterium]RYC37155.1 hypothetical protein DEH81_21955 [Pectobacterium zantedeschiae]TAJ01847.1 hypothetical protein EG334_22020 [Pectobacterium versatile]
MKKSSGIIKIYGTEHLLKEDGSDKELPIYIVYDSNGPRLIGYYFSLEAALNAMEDELSKYLTEEESKESIDESEKNLSNELSSHLFDENKRKLNPVGNTPPLNEDEKNSIEDYLKEILDRNLKPKQRKIRP